MKFSIITPTHKRVTGLMRAVDSVMKQSHTDWEMIIVNDSPADTTYNSFSSSINDSRIHYHVNERNEGVNYSRNYALDKISVNSEWVIFLDDDDYLAPDTLSTLSNLIQKNSHRKWFVTNRARTGGDSLTKFPRSDKEYSYALSYLISKRCKGDATHCIQTNLIHKIRFSEHVKQGEEWFFFYQVGLHSPMYYHNHNSTLSDGYSATGLNFRKRTRSQQFETLSVLAYEGAHLNLIYHPTFLIYLCMRLIRILVKS
jgi:glycosyltransferase involved in cell wall biosynthesis